MLRLGEFIATPRALQQEKIAQKILISSGLKISILFYSGIVNHESMQ